MSDQKKQNQYTAEFREPAVKLAIESDQPVGGELVIFETKVFENDQYASGKPLCLFQNRAGLLPDSVLHGYAQ